MIELVYEAPRARDASPLRAMACPSRSVAEAPAVGGTPINMVGIVSLVIVTAIIAVINTIEYWKSNV
jgi:hypothetical protein